jgi:hypothetical protein
MKHHIDVMRYFELLIILFLGLMMGTAGCFSSNTETCSVASELARCNPPADCCAGTCIRDCTDPGVEQTYSYVLRGSSGEISTRLFTGVNNYSACIGETVQDEFRLTCEHRSLLSSDHREVFLDERNTTLLKFEDSYQNRFLSDLLSAIHNRTEDNDDELRIAVSLVQHIPYDTGKQEEFLRGEYSANRLPYQVLYENFGICNEKAKLLAYFLKNLGYGVALLSYPGEKHMAVGILSPQEYRTPGCGNYTYIESTQPTIISQLNQGIQSYPEIIVLADGRAFDSIGEEFADARELERLFARKNGLTREEYNHARILAQKYDLNITFR